MKPPITKTDNPTFTRFDVPVVLRDLLVTACHFKVLDMADAFAMGMNQAELPDWEQWDAMVDYVCECAYTSRHSLTNGQDAHSAIVKKAEQYWREQYESKVEAACDYTGPEL